jgi:hypothetical protein
MSLISIGIIFALRRPEPVEAPPALPDAPAAPRTAAEILGEGTDDEVHEEDLDSTRFAG